MYLFNNKKGGIEEFIEGEESESNKYLDSPETFIEQFNHDCILGKHSVFSFIKNNGIIRITDGICNFNPSFSWQTMHKKGIPARLWPIYLLY